MPTTTTTALRYHPNAYQFIFAALRFTQQTLGRNSDPKEPKEDGSEAHISGRELLEGIKEFGQQEFGLLARTVFRGWGVTKTEDFGHIVFELVERGEMRKTDSDHIHDFVGVYEFADALDGTYEIDCSVAFGS